MSFQILMQIDEEQRNFLASFPESLRDRRTLLKCQVQDALGSLSADEVCTLGRVGGICIGSLEEFLAFCKWTGSAKGCDVDLRSVLNVASLSESLFVIDKAIFADRRCSPEELMAASGVLSGQELSTLLFDDLRRFKPYEEWCDIDTEAPSEHSRINMQGLLKTWVRDSSAFGGRRKEFPGFWFFHFVCVAAMHQPHFVFGGKHGLLLLHRAITHGTFHAIAKVGGGSEMASAAWQSLSSVLDQQEHEYERLIREWRKEVDGHHANPDT